MSQGPLGPKFDQKIQKEVSQMANCNLSYVMLSGGLNVNLNHLKPRTITKLHRPLQGQQVKFPN